MDEASDVPLAVGDEVKEAKGFIAEGRWYVPPSVEGTTFGHTTQLIPVHVPFVPTRIVPPRQKASVAPTFGRAIAVLHSCAATQVVVGVMLATNAETGRSPDETGSIPFYNESQTVIRRPCVPWLAIESR